MKMRKKGMKGQKEEAHWECTSKGKESGVLHLEPGYRAV